MEFVIEGSGFDLLPYDIIGVVSNHNETPLESRYNQDNRYYCEVVFKSDTRIEMAAASAVGHSALYLGGLVSYDREIVYWQNDTQPLP